MGRSKAPGRKGGVKAHGRKRKMLRIALSRRVIHQAFVAALSSKLAEGNLRITSKAEVEEIKTKLAAPILSTLDSHRILILTEKDVDHKFIKSTNALD